MDTYGTPSSATTLGCEHICLFLTSQLPLALLSQTQLEGDSKQSKASQLQGLVR